MKNKNESARELGIGKDYVNVNDNNLIVIDRAGDFDNRGFYGDWYRKDIPCINCGTWREATEEEVIGAFKKHLPHRFGKDWETMKIKKRHPSSSLWINHGSWEVEIVKSSDGWNGWNENGLLYCDGIWVERLEAELYKFADIKELRPKRKAMKEAKAIIEEKYNVKLEDLK